MCRATSSILYIKQEMHEFEECESWYSRLETKDIWHCTVCIADIKIGHNNEYDWAAG